jgi:putative SOS response-associated peptidase YedK
VDELDLHCAKAKRPYHFRPKAEPFAFAGVYDVWKSDGGRAITSFAIVTTDAASSVAQYHSPMPARSRRGKSEPTSAM